MIRLIDRFASFLPQMRRCARFAFRHLKPDARAEAVQGAIALALVMYRRLQETGYEDLAYPTPLINYGIRQFKSGRNVGTSQNKNDVSSIACKIAKKLHVQRIDRYDPELEQWTEAQIEDHRATPAQIVQMKLDFPDWKRRFSRRIQRLITALARSERTKDVSEQFDISPGRVSQLRQELKEDWSLFTT
jgi:hypothetical protein